jgi:hypothetical protein
LEGLKTIIINKGKVNFHHIFGQQDRSKKNLSDIEKLNVHADKLATKGRLLPNVKDINLETDNAILFL